MSVLRDVDRLSLARRALAEASSHVGLAAQPGADDPARPTQFPTGIAALDAALGGGLPRGRIVALSGARSSGRMALTLRLLARATHRGEPAALIDGVDALDPADLHADERARVLWVRPRSLLAALQCTDLILDAGGFAMAALYLVGVRERVPASAWTRLAQRAAQANTTLLVVGDGAGTAPGSFAAVSLAARRRRAVWAGRRLLDAVQGELVVLRRRGGPGSSVPVGFGG
jgi:RecA/RadA recombinase